MKRLTLAMFLAVVALPAAAVAQVDLDSDKKAQPAQPQELPAEARPAVAVVTEYLDAVKAKKWANAKKLTHKRTLDAIAQRKKNLGDEDHPMAPWFYEKNQYFLKNYRIMGAQPGPMDTWIIETSEDNFQVQEKGIAEGDMATYLVGKTGGKWTIVDKKRGVTFTKDSVKYGYRGYFDEAKKAE